MTFPDGKQLRIYDCRGIDFFDWNTKHYVNDLIKTVDGGIKKDYEVHIFFSLVFLNLFLKLRFVEASPLYRPGFKHKTS